MIHARLRDERVVTESSDAARELHARHCYGTLLKGGSVQLSEVEALYLMDRGKISVTDGRNVAFDEQRFVYRFRKYKELWIHYCVYKDLRTRGYIVKTALKFGATYRVYDKGIRPGQDHARWIVYPVREQQSLTWHEFSARNRVAHSTKKRLLIGVVDEENDVTYYEIRWTRP